MNKAFLEVFGSAYVMKVSVAVEEALEETRTRVPLRLKRTLRTIGRLIGEIDNGGIDQYLFNSASSEYSSLAACAHELDFPELDKWQRQLAAYFPSGKVPGNRNKRQSALALLNKKANGRDPFSKSERHFRAIRAQLESKMEDYLLKHQHLLSPLVSAVLKRWDRKQASEDRKNIYLQPLRQAVDAVMSKQLPTFRLRKLTLQEQRDVGRNLLIYSREYSPGAWGFITFDNVLNSKFEAMIGWSLTSDMPDGRAWSEDQYFFGGPKVLESVRAGMFSVRKLAGLSSLSFWNIPTPNVVWEEIPSKQWFAMSERAQNRLTAQARKEEKQLTPEVVQALYEPVVAEVVRLIRRGVRPR